MSMYEPQYTVNRCGNCKWIDMIVVLTSIPPQAYCKLFRRSVYLTSETCLDDMEPNKREEE